MDYHSGKVLVRMPKDLHVKLVQLAEQNGVSLNMYIVFLLSNALSEQLAIEHPQKEALKIKEEKMMGQDFHTGRRGNKVGRYLGEVVAKRLGIQREKGSNKGMYNNRVVVIKSARRNNSQFGITNRMAEEIDDVILAKETREGHFDLYLVSFDKIKDTARPSASRSNKDKVANYKISQAITEGKKFDSIQIDMDFDK